MSELYFVSANSDGIFHAASDTSRKVIPGFYDTTQIRVQANLDGDADTGDADEDIIYAYDAVNDIITRETGGSTETLVEYIDAFTFQYLNESSGATTTSGEIRQIQITITARTAKSDPNYTPNGGYRTYTLTSLITPRNLAY